MRKGFGSMVTGHPLPPDTAAYTQAQRYNHFNRGTIMYRSRTRAITLSRVSERTVHCIRLCAEMRRLLQVIEHKQPTRQTQAQIVEDAVWQHYDTLRHKLTRLARVTDRSMMEPLIRERLGRVRLDSY